MKKIKFEDGKLIKNAYVVIDGKEYLVNDAQYDGLTPLSSYILNKIQDNIEEGIDDVQALPTGGTKGQVLTKQSETEGDANWEDIEANEVFVGNEEEAPKTAKIIIEDEDFEESSGLSKAEIYVGAEEPVAGEKVWFNKDENSIYVKNSNGVYEEFTKKDEEKVSLIKKYYSGTTLDCNNITESGIYAIDTNNNITNGPTLVENNLNLLTVFNSGQVVQQIWNNYDTLFLRSRWWDTWSSWKKISN